MDALRTSACIHALLTLSWTSLSIAWTCLVASNGGGGELAYGIVGIVVSLGRLLWYLFASRAQTECASSLKNAFERPERSFGTSSSSRIESVDVHVAQGYERLRRWHDLSKAWFLFEAGACAAQIAGAITSESTYRALSIASAACASAALLLRATFASGSPLRWRHWYETDAELWRAHGESKHARSGSYEAVKRFATVSMADARSRGRTSAQIASGMSFLMSKKKRMLQVDKTEGDVLDRRRALSIMATHRYSVAAYTGMLLDAGRWYTFGPCATGWKHGVLMPWMWSMHRKTPVQDNLIGGHASRFARAAGLELADVRSGSCENRSIKRARRRGIPSETETYVPAHFLAMVHEAKIVVLAIRGTENLDDILVDVSADGVAIEPEDAGWSRNDAESCMKWGEGWTPGCLGYAHRGVLDATRSLAKRLEQGEALSVLKEGLEAGYRIRITGHSLGGSIATLLAIRWRVRFRATAVAFSPMPSIDRRALEALGPSMLRDIITCVVYGDDIVPRLSMRNMRRLADAAGEAWDEEHGKTARSFSAWHASTFAFQHACRCFCCMGKYSRKESLATKAVPISHAGVDGSMELTQPPGTGEIDADAASSIELLRQTYQEVPAPSPSSIFPSPTTETAHTCQEQSSAEDTVAKSIECCNLNMSKEVKPEATVKQPHLVQAGLIFHLQKRRVGEEQQPNERLLVGKRYTLRTRTHDFFDEALLSDTMLLDHLPWRTSAAIADLSKSLVLEGGDVGMEVIVKP